MEEKCDDNKLLFLQYYLLFPCFKPLTSYLFQVDNLYFHLLFFFMCY